MSFSSNGTVSKSNQSFLSTICSCITACDEREVVPSYDLEAVKVAAAELECSLAYTNQAKGNVAEAILLYQQCIRRYNNHIEAHYNLATCFQQKGEITSAIAHFSRVVELQPNHFLANYNLGYLFYFELNERNSALKFFEIAASLNSKDTDTWINIGLLYRDFGALEKSVGSYMKALEIDPLSEMAYYNLGNTYYDFKMSTEAIQCYSKTIIINPKHSDALFNLGVVYHGLQDMDKALDCYEKAVLYNPTLLEAKKALKSMELYYGKKKSTLLGSV